MTTTLPPVELRFLAWLAKDRSRATTILQRLPHEVFSDDARAAALSLATGQPWIHDANPLDDMEARDYLRTQILGLVGKELARAQRSKETRELGRIIDLFELCSEGALGALPVAKFDQVEPKIRDVVPTGVQDLDDQIRGLARGDLGFVFMPSGKGKTLVLINFAVSALRSGKTVLYISVGDQSKDELIPRIDTCILEHPMPHQATEAVLKNRHHNAMKRISGTLWIADYTDRECTIDDIDRTIREIPADLVIVDHADDVLCAYSDDPTVTRHSLRLVYTTLKKLAVKYEVPIWTASQSSELSWHFRSTSIADLAEAKIGKATGAAVVLGFSVGPEKEVIPGRVLCTIAKARRSYTERVVPLNYDQQVCRIW